jgi:hypothetical protein
MRYGSIASGSRLKTSVQHESERSVSRSEALAAQAADETARCTAWLLKFMQNDQPKFLTKAELCNAAMAELGISKNSFNFAWISAIEQTGRHDWYEPLRRRYRTKT